MSPDFTKASRPNKKPGVAAGLLIVRSARLNRVGLRRLVLDRGVIAIAVVGFVDLGFAVGLGAGFGLGAAARALGELAFDFLDGFGFRRVLHDGDFTRQAIERRFVELAFAVGLLGLRFRTIEIADHFGDRDDVAGIDLGFVFLRAARPH